MHLVEQTPTRLKLQIKHKFLNFLLTLFGSLFFVAGLAAILSGELTILKCNRLEPSQVRCELISSKLLEKHITRIPTGQLQGAEVEKLESDDDYVSYRVVLLTKNGK